MSSKDVSVVSITSRLTPSMVKNLFDYRDGRLFWRERPKSHFKSLGSWKSWHAKNCGKEARSSHPDGYLQVRITINGNGTAYLVHRLVWAWHYGRWPSDQIDHIDHNRSNNLIENLREVTNAENQKNASLRNNNESGFSGVHWHKRDHKWQAHIGNGKMIHLGYFDRFEEAVAARKAAEQVYGYHANHGKAA